LFHLMISLHATRPARIARRTSWRRDPVTGGGELETYSPFSVSMGQALWVIMIIAGPPLILMLVVGLVISMVQAATSINEQTVSFVPKLLAFILFLAIYGATVGDLLIDYTRDLLMHIPDDIR
ncbi:flagellar biosynthetic protein FliQ, partial [Pseudomonas sp. RA_35y_Pfl2_P32]|uniref:flagellar biosynthetic protein FliQ n=2 Tax=Pseudomonadota TaxID=1224 RepID=UPI0030DB04E2